MQSALPTLFISHGAPDLILSDQPSARVLRGLAAHLARPRALVVASAHWFADPVGLTGAGMLETIHDFSGFPERLYAERYPARGDPGLCDEIRGLLDGAAIEHRIDENRGLDHGAWVPLKLAFPAGDVPVAQVSLPPGGLEPCARLGAALAPLARYGVLIIGSGGAVHNLRALRPGGEPESWATGFEAWLRDTIEAGEFQRLLSPWAHAPGFAEAHPSIDHYAPLVFAWAAGGRERPGRRFTDGFMYRNLGMSGYVFGASENFRMPAPRTGSAEGKLAESVPGSSV
jgi:4,5-DOPA dioxygenase extradiol